MREPYITIQDKFGAKAIVYTSYDDFHEIIYEDDRGHKFYTEEYKHMPLEAIEQRAIDWATGKRELS